MSGAGREKLGNSSSSSGFEGSDGGNLMIAEDDVSPTDHSFSSPPPSTSSHTRRGPSPPPIELTEVMIKNFVVEKEFPGNGDAAATPTNNNNKNQNPRVVNHIAFSSDGLKAAASGTDEYVVFYNLEDGTQDRMMASKKYGCDLVTFTHSNTTILMASTKNGNNVRYVSLHDNKFLRCFVAHEDTISGLSMSPKDDTFLTTSKDNTLRLWDLRTQNFFAIMNLQTEAVGSFDPEGLTFAVALKELNAVKMYDLRAYENGPFATFLMPNPLDNSNWTGMTFSPNGNRFLVNTDGPYVYGADAFTGVPYFVAGSRQCVLGRKLDAIFTPNAKHVMSANGDGNILVWNAKNGKFIFKLRSPNPRLVGSLKFNPKYCMLMSAYKDTAFWVADLDMIEGFKRRV